MFIKKCITCNCEFDSIHANKKRCSRCDLKLIKRKYDGVTKKCIVCNKDFQPNTLIHYFCSDECRYKIRKTSRIIDIPNLREFILERDNFTCQKCNKIFEYLSNLNIHHAIPLFKGGKHEINNLITLCKECHVKEHELINYL